jgi:phytoene/squalene synthetase
MPTSSSVALKLGAEQTMGYPPFADGREKGLASGPALAQAITRAASKQTYYTIRLLVDRDRVSDAYRAYAYYRWVDDTLDQDGISQQERLAFVARQQALMDDCYEGRWPATLAKEEALLLQLVRRERSDKNGLLAYLDNMMAVMAFDAERRGRLVSQAELDAYTHWLAVAVTEALHYFIGHGSYAPHGEERYLAVKAAHITHMLRDTVEDIDAGYYNVPNELLLAQGITPRDIEGEAYRQWVQSQVELARAYFEAGKRHLAKVENARCRLAGCAYIARFEGVLEAISREGYLLRAGYPECKGAPALLRGGRLAIALAIPRRHAVSPVFSAN